MQTIESATGRVISFHYALYDEASNQVETSEGHAPIRFLQGENRVLAALQEAFVGRNVGEEFSVTIPHSQAYGRHYPDRVKRVPAKQVDGGKRKMFRAGDVVQLPGPRGPQSARVVKPGKFHLDVDLNHPLAGCDLTFAVTVVEVREATEEEQAHGHAHGPGGHQH